MSRKTILNSLSLNPSVHTASLLKRKSKATILLVLCAALFQSSPLHAQKAELSLEDAILKRFTDFDPERVQGLQWLPNTDEYSYIKSEGEEELLMRVNASTSEEEEVISLSKINEILQPDISLEGLRGLKWKDGEHLFLKHERSYILIDLESISFSTLLEIPDDAEHATPNADLTACAFIQNNNLFIVNDEGMHQITDDGGNGIVYGQSVHRQEFGIRNGLFWSPEGERLAYYRKDESMVDDYLIVDITTTPATTDFIKYPMAGRTSEEVTLEVYNWKTDKKTKVDSGSPKDQYLTAISWAPDDAFIYIGVLNRDQNHLSLNQYDASSGKKLSTLFDETDEQYVEPEHSMWFIPGHPDQFIWMSERDGYQHLYLFNTKGEQLRRLSFGDWEVHEILGMNENGEYLFVKGTGEVIRDRDGVDFTRNATQRYTYKLNFDTGSKKIIGDEIGTHSTTLSPSGTYLLDQFSSIDVPLKTQLLDANGKVVDVLLLSEDPLKDYRLAKPEFGILESGQPLHSRIIKPSDFDPSKQYPVLVYVYGGPHAQLVTNRYLGGAPLWMYWMAEQGYIIATVDNRGSANRGIEFEQSTFRKLGDLEVADQIQFAKYLADLPYTDRDRMALHGWSYGGFMTINIFLSYPGLFKVGVAGGPVIDWKFYEVMYTERYMDTPEANSEGYAKSSLLNRAENLEDDLLIIHGTSDPTVVWQHSQAFLKKCVDLGIQLDYFVYPGHGHNVRGKDRYHLMKKVLSYIDARIGD